MNVLIVNTISLAAVLDKLLVRMDLTKVWREFGQIAPTWFLGREPFGEHGRRHPSHRPINLVAGTRPACFSAVMYAPRVYLSVLVHWSQSFVHCLSQIDHIFELRVFAIELDRAKSCVLSILWVFLKLGEWIDQLVLGFLVTEKKTVRSNCKEEVLTLIVVRFMLKRSRFRVEVGRLFSISLTRC